MTWRTPCTDGRLDAEAWTSDDPTERLAAQQECLTCPRLIACFADADRMHRNGLEVSGVHGGYDFTRTKNTGRSLAPSECANCGRVFPQAGNGRPTRFCSPKCRKIATERAA